MTAYAAPGVIPSLPAAGGQSKGPAFRPFRGLRSGGLQPKSSLFALGGRTFRSDIKHGPTYTVIPSGATRLFLPHGLCAPGRVERNLLLPFHGLRSGGLQTGVRVAASLPPVSKASVRCSGGSLDPQASKASALLTPSGTAISGCAPTITIAATGKSDNGATALTRTLVAEVYPEVRGEPACRPQVPAPVGIADSDSYRKGSRAT